MSALRVAVYDLYWSTLGGGERVDGTIAEVLASEHDVTLLGPAPIDEVRTMERLGVDLRRCRHRRVCDDAEASAASADYDVFVNGTYLSTAINRAAIGWYYVHFPERPPSWRSWARHGAGVAGVRALRHPRLPKRLKDAQTAFDRRVRRTEFRPTYQHYLANSRFTAGWVERLWGVPCEVLYPPVPIEIAAGSKRPLVLNVGRFFDPRLGHSKRQLELIEAFATLDLAGWELALAGGCDAASREYALAARRAAVGRPIDVHVNARGDVVRRLFSEASIYWHAAGLGSDPERQPHQFEHFGITVVEAMAAGAVPLVFGAAGPAEIVRDGVDGHHWHDVAELAELTLALAGAPAERARLSANAQAHALTFSAARFADEVRALVRQES